MRIGESRRAARTDVYLNALLGADERRAGTIPEDVELDSDIRLAARALRADLMRIHPSFLFEERLAARLAAAAARMRAGLPVDDVVGEPAPASGPAPEAPVQLHRVEIPEPVAAEAEPRPGALPRLPAMPYPLLVGGVASAALSLGAVYVAWRRTRPPAMTRAVRAAHAGRLATHLVPGRFGGLG